MKVSILPLGAILVALQTIYVMAEPQPGGPYAPSKGSLYASKDVWQESWDSSKTGRHVYKSYPDHRERKQHGHVQLDNFLKKLVSEHGDLKAPKKCRGVNEEWSDCGKDPCEQPSCLNFGKPLKCNPDGACVAGCTCKKGYYRNKKNKCVKPNKCANYRSNLNEEHKHSEKPKKSQNVLQSAEENTTTTPSVAPSTAPTTTPTPTRAGCPINEFLERCIQFRRPESCEDIYTPYNVTLITINSPVCTPRCICNFGFYRNATGSCVPVDQCPNYRCNSQEFYDRCPRKLNCDECGDEVCNGVPLLPRRDIHYLCTPQCLCDWREYCRNSSGVCIINRGPESCPKPNTRYSECAKELWAQSCERRGDILETPDESSCFEGCECMPGYYKNTTLDCVAPENCECPVGENYRCNDECTASTCEDLFRNYTGCLDGRDWRTWKCNNSCMCPNDQYRNSAGRCVNYSECPCPDPNAEMVDCPYRCTGRTCDNPFVSLDCDNSCFRSRQRLGCQCKDGYVRRSLSDPTCILVDTCPSVQG